jgi:hypothetical protein
METIDIQLNASNPYFLLPQTSTYLLSTTENALNLSKSNNFSVYSTYILHTKVSHSSDFFNDL